MNINRKQAPGFKSIEKIDITKAVEHNLTNNIKVNIINAGDQEISKIDFIFNAGEVLHSNPLVPIAVNSMLNKGTSKYTSAVIAEKFDFYGAFLQFDSGKHTGGITLYTLNKYLEPTLELISELIYDATIPESELSIWKQQAFQGFQISLEKTETLARNKFYETIFNGHSYGNVIKESNFQALDKTEADIFYNSAYKTGALQIVVSGIITDNHLVLLEKHFGNRKISHEKIDLSSQFAVQKQERTIYNVPKKNAVQSSILQGKVLINKLHPDYMQLKVANTILGGYFGSRLMKNIREDKGYTYGIGSVAGSYLNAGFFMIYADTGKKVAKKAIIEIDKEIQIFRNELVSEKELSTVKNYMLGNLLRSFDGPFSLADAFISIRMYELGYDYFERYIDTIKNITSEQVRDIAVKYMDDQTMIQVIAG